MSILTQPEGFITGMASKMFVVAGPVIVFGTLASVVYGVVLMLLWKKGAPRRSLFSHTSAPFRQGGKLTKFAFYLFHRAEEAEAYPFMVYPRLFC